MGKILIVWHDRDGTRTTHSFENPGAAEPWLRDVLAEYCPAEELELGGYEASGLGMLSYYTHEGPDDVGSFEVYIDGLGVTPDALHD